MTKLFVLQKKKKYKFHINEDEIQELYDLITALKNKEEQSDNETEVIEKPKTNSLYFFDKRDWELILKGGVEVNFDEGEVILEEGIYLNRIYEIVNGFCIIQKDTKDKKVNIAKLTTGDIIGEMSFLSKNPSSAAVIAGDGGATLIMIEGHYINSTFVNNPQMASNYFCYIAERLSHKLHLTEKKELKKKEKRRRKKEQE